jgi:hypothetical protein
MNVMKNNFFVPLLFLVVMQSIAIKAMDTAPLGIELYIGKEKGPMNPDWFYTSHEPYLTINKFHQKQEWHTAVRAHELYNDRITMLLDLTVKVDGQQHRVILPGPEEKQYAQNMALLNLAVCTMAQRKPSEHWASFDKLINIPAQKCISKRMIAGGELRDKLVRVRTDAIEISDLFRFMETANILKKRTGCYVVFSVHNFLKNTLMSLATMYDFGLVGEQEDCQPLCDYETHIIGLLGHLELEPAQTAPDRVILTSSERAMVTLDQKIKPLLAAGKRFIAAHIGDNRSEVSIGGRKVGNKNLNASSFASLLKKNKDLVLIDLGMGDSCVGVDEDQQEQYINIASQEHILDRAIAVALLMNDNKKMVGLFADTDIANVFIRALSQEAQKRFAFIIPRGGCSQMDDQTSPEYNACMEGNGFVHRHMLSNCSVYKGVPSTTQEYIVEQAYKNIVD